MRSSCDRASGRTAVLAPAQRAAGFFQRSLEPAEQLSFMQNSLLGCLNPTFQLHSKQVDYHSKAIAVILPPSNAVKLSAIAASLWPFPFLLKCQSMTVVLPLFLTPPPPTHSFMQTRNGTPCWNTSHNGAMRVSIQTSSMTHAQSSQK